MSNDAVMTVTVKGIGDFSDVVSNVGSVQKALTKLKLPDKLGDNLSKNITNFYKEYEKYQKKISEGIKTQGDYNQVEKSLNNMRNLYQAIGKDAQKLTQLDMKDMLNLDTDEFKKISSEITNIVKQIGSVKIDTSAFTKAFADIRNVTKNSKISGEDGLLNQIIGHINTGQIAAAKKELQELQNYANKVAPRETASGKRAPGTLSPEKYQQLTTAINSMNGAVAQAEATMNPLIEKENQLQKELEETKQKAAQGIAKEFKGYNQASGEVEKLTDSLKRMHQEEFSFNREAQNIDRQIQSYFGLSQMIRKVGDIARDAFATVKELDKAMTETAVVTNFSVGDMWDMLPTYTQQANQLGSTIKDVYEAATLYYQQGLNTNQAMSLANETLKMARIAGLDAADATNMMTAALRGFNMELNQQSAQKINDIYSELAAITASDTKEIGSAMERTASIANSANMEFATTSAFLAQMIETTREAPENLGTAMKTIVARFQEMKQDPTKLVDSEGVAMDANKVDKALKTIGVQLMNTKGEFRDLDDVFLDISAKWDSLTQGQQRYIATIAAGSRQQSRFIAMMSNYERTMELVDAANNSAGASQRQFEKTLDSMEAKLNKLKNAWDQFTMGLMNNQILKFGVDALTEGFTIVNKFIDILGKIPPKPFEGVTKSILTLITTLGMLNFGKKATRGLVLGGTGWFKGETSFTGGFKEGWKQSGQTGFFANRKNNVAAAQGKADAVAYNAAVQNEMVKGGFTKAIAMAWKTKGQNFDFTNTFGAAFGQFSGERFAASWSVDIEAEITRVLNSVIKDSAKIGEVAGKEFKQNLIAQLRAGNINGEQLISSVRQVSGEDISNLGVNAKQFKDGAEAATNFGIKIGLAGDSLLRFGAVLQGTPLAPFGSMLSTVGMAVSNFGSAFAKATTIFTNGMNMVVQSEITGSLATAGLAGGFKALWGALLESPLFPIVAALLALYGTYKLLDAAIVSNKEQLEAATDAAAAASEAYDSAKQETSELADAINTIRETDSAFDGLVAGTAEFNEQLITANEQIMTLIDKYPMLMDASKNYVTTDANGLMHISEAGFKAVKEYQKQIQANTSAMNLIQASDLNALENQQKAQKLRNDIKTNMSDDEQQRNLREADLLEQRAKAEVELARSNAIRTALTGKEIHDIDALTSIYTNLYDTKRKTAEVEVNGLGKHDIRQRYADYHGYTYNKSTKKITDVEGNDIDYDDNVIKDEVVEQTVLLDFENNAASLEIALSQVDAKFADTLKSTSESSKHFISDVLANNIDTDEDLLEQALSGTDFQDAVNSMTEKEMAAILGINAEAINEENIDAKRDEIVNLLTNNATKIAEAQSESYSELATMMAQSKGWDTITAEQQKNQQEIQKQIKDLTSEQAHMMSNIGSQLKEGAGIEVMQSYINHMSDLYTKINEKGKESDKEAAKEIEDIFNSVDLTSATGKLEVYTKLTQSSVKATRDWGEELRSTAGEANLLGNVFDEFLGGDWLELAEHADDFKNSLGQIDTAGILKASEQSHTLKTMLDSGEVSASGLAIALQGVEDGKYSIGAVNDSVLQLLSSLNRIEDEAMKAHNLIENFDAGIDYGEASDFAKENAEKAQEYWNNGEFGNQQLQNYIKLAAGQERWNKAVQEHHGDLELVEKDLLKYVTTFKDGFQPVIDQLISGKGIDGDSLNKNIEQAVKAGTLDKTLAEKFKQVVPRIEGDDFIFGTEGSKATNLTTEELKTYLEQVYGVSTEYAQLILEEWTNLSPDLAAELSKNDLMAAISSNEFKATHGTTESGQTILTDQEISVLENAGGTEALEKVAEELGYAATDQKSAAEVMKDASFKVLDEEGNRIDNSGDHGALLQSYIKTFNKAEKGSIESLFKTGTEDLFTNGTLDLSKLITDTQAHGLDQEQAMQAAWQAYQRGEQINERTSYDGVLLEKGIATYEDFTASIESALEAGKWQSIGESIAQGIINFINKEDPGETDTTSKDYSQEKENAKVKADADAEREANVRGQEVVWSWLKKVFSSDAYENNKPDYQKEKTSDDTSKEIIENNNQANEGLTEAAGQITTGAESLTTAGESLNTAATNLTTAAAVIVSNSSPQTSNQGGTVPNVPQNAQPNQSSISGAIVIDNSAALATLDEVYNKATETAEKINEGATFTIKAPGLTKLTKAADAAQKVSDSAGSKSISLNTSVSGASADSVNTIKESVKKFNALKSHKVTLTTSLKGASVSSIDNIITAINSFHSKTDHTVTLKTIKETVNKDAATGAHNHGYAAPPSFGSAARGSYGQVGPKGKGGLTLTGELGYEIAWIPSENRSMILGANGPQMVDLPGDAVVWTHEQSKKMLSQKAIQAGSHFRISQQGGSGGSGGGGGGGSTPKGSQTPSSYHREITKILTKGGKVSVWWENIARMAETRERAAAKTQKKFDKLLQTFGTTATKAEKVADTYRADLQKVINVNKKQVNKANGELRYLDKKGKASISYQVTKKKGSKKTTETKKETVNIGKFIKQMEDGTYIIDQKAITKIAKKNKAKAEAIKQAIEQRLNDKISKRNKALDEIEKAQDKLAEISNNIYDTFYRWEFSLNKIYFLAQKLSSLAGQMDYRQSREELISNRVLAGYGPATATDQINQLLNVLEEEKKLMIDQVEANIANAEATKEAYLNSIDFKSYVERYEKAPDAEHAAEDIKAAKWALRLIEEGGNFDESQIEKLKNQGYNEYTINQIKEILEDIDQKRKDALQASTDANTSINTIYNKIVEYESYISEFEADLLTGIEEQTEKEINRLDKLNSSLSKAYKDLLDEVKRALDERRKREDNAKTERDIAQKQQRLAALRADTSGGHQVEIAQLEKEIAEAQQNYQRTLEDQLLENLQNQGDKAEKQRQQQIELLQAQKEIAQQTGTNLLQVQEWLKDPEKNKEQIRAAWLANRGYDDMTESQKASAEREFDEAWMKYGAYLTEVADLREVASNTKFESIDSSVKLGQIAGDVEKIANQVIGTKATGGIGWSSFKAGGGTAAQARELGALASSVQSVWGTKATFNAGYTKKALTEAGITVKDLHQVGIKAGALKKRGYEASELKDYYSIKELAEAGYSYKTLKKFYSDTQIKKALNANLAKSIGVPDKTIAKWYGSKAALKAGASGAAVQSAKGTGLQTQQKIVNESKKDKATQSSLAGISTKLDTNGKKKGGKISATVNASGKSVTGNKGSTLYTRKIDTKTGKLTGDVTTTKIADLSTADFTKNKKEATDALIYAIKHREVGSKISSKMKSLVSAAGIAGKTYKLKNNVTASVGANGKIYYATKDAVKIWDASAGKVDVDKYNKNEYLKKAQKNNSVSREYAQALINRNAFTKPQLQKKGVKKFATGGLASYTGPAWLDGTPSRPELVLNAKDTQNFIALKDVLANAMSGMGDTSNTYGDVLYEININVDKIEKDYDVDRVVKKVKEEITKGAGYRNVTQVRNFR